MTFNHYLFLSKAYIVDVLMGSKRSSDSMHPSQLFLRENNKNLPIILDDWIIL